MEPYVWQIAIGSIVLSLLSGLPVLYAVRRFDRRFGKQADPRR